MVRCVCVPHFYKTLSHTLTYSCTATENRKREQRKANTKNSQQFSVNNESIPCVVFFVSVCDEMLLFKIYYRKKQQQQKRTLLACLLARVVEF